MKADLSLRVLWSIANAEASFAGAKHISPDFFWLATLKLFDENLPKAVKKLGVEADDTTQLIHIANDLKQFLEISERRATWLRRRLRRKLRSQLSSLPYGKETTILHRSPESREVFYIAAKIAKKSGTQSISAFHIVRALFDSDYVTVEDLNVDRNSSAGRS